MADKHIVSPLLAKVILKFSELGDAMEALLEEEDKIKAYENFELVLTLNNDTRLRVFEEGVQVEYF